RGASRLAERALIDRAVLTPKIELPIERRLQLLQRAPATCQRRRRFTLRAETLAVDLEVGVDPRVQRRPRGIGERERLACPRCGDLQRGAAGERLVDQLIELRIFER